MRDLWDTGVVQMRGFVTYQSINPKISVTLICNKQALKEELREGGYVDEFINQILESEFLWYISSYNNSGHSVVVTKPTNM